MERRFNVTGSCSPQRHYMVRLDDRLKKIKEDYIDYGSYFVINRGRQYGKTTTLAALEKYLKKDYTVLSLDFQQMGTEDFTDAATFAHAFAAILIETLEINGLDDREELMEPLTEIMERDGNSLKDLFVRLSRMCRNSAQPIVLMIDEVDSAGNNQVFIEFLAQLRGYYLKRDKMPIFHSVVLAGVYSIKNLKLKLRPESEHQYNSPWNIAAKFNVDMSFSQGQIASMLQEYEADYHTGMEVQKIAEEIYQYTSGYPVLVSYICKYIDEELYQGEGENHRDSAWSKEGIIKAVKALLVDSIPLFGSMIRHVNEYPEMKKMFQAILFEGSDVVFNPYTKEISLACMFGYAVDSAGKVRIANRIFETCLYNYFLSEEELSSVIGSRAQNEKNSVVHGGKLDMDALLRKFVEHYSEIYGEKDVSFLEKHGRKIFLLYLKSVINGTGNYYVEAETRDGRRTDVIVDYLGEQYIIELKIWHGSEYNERGENQLADYLAYYQKDRGYMLSFNFNKNKQIGVQEIHTGGRTIVEAVV